MPSFSLISVRCRDIIHHYLPSPLARFRDWLGGSRVQISGYGNSVNYNSSRLIRSQILVSGSHNLIIVKAGTRLIDSMISISGSGHYIEIGENCILGCMTLVLKSSNCSAYIGSSSTSASVNIDLGEPDLTLRIGKDCMISHRVEIMCGDAHSLHDLTSGLRLNHPRDVTIGDHVWLAAETAVLKGSVVGDHTTIGFRSVVTSPIPPHSRAVGIPARVIRSGVTWRRDLPWQLSQ